MVIRTIYANNGISCIDKMKSLRHDIKQSDKMDLLFHDDLGNI